MEKKILQFIFDNQLIKAGDRILIGVSGGADSLALLYFLEKYAAYFKIEIGAAHLHHGLRGRAADDDCEQVRCFCHKKAIAFYTKEVDVQKIAKEQKMSFEEAGRTARHQFFKTIQSANAYNKLALGHHLNDQAETVLMRMIRGTGIKGASGILPKTENPICIIRPFLGTTKTQILAYCKKNALDFCVDATNFEADTTRNKLRLEILPAIKDINPKVEQHLYEFAQLSQEYETFFQKNIQNLVEKALTFQNKSVFLDLSLWEKQDPLVQKELLRHLLAGLKGSLKEIEYNHILHAWRLLLSENTLWEYHLPQGLMLYRKYNQVWVTERAIQGIKMDFGCYALFSNKEYFFSREALYLKLSVIDVKMIKKTKDLKNHSEKYFDYGKIGGRLYLRSRQSGDFFCPVGLTGRKKLKDYFIDRKIEKEKRDQIPLLALGSEVIWILGYAINKNYQIDEKTTEVLKIEYKKVGEEFESRFE